MKTAFIGLGVMGGPMASHLSKAGYEVNVYNRTLKKAEQHVANNGGTVCETPAIAASGADIVFACVGNDDDVRAVTVGDEGAFSTMKAGSIFVDHTTTSAELAVECATKAETKDIHFLDIGFGSGCILLSILKERKNFKATGVDISKDAIKVCKINAYKLGVKNRLRLLKSDIDKIFMGKYDLIISNPPYIKKLDFRSLKKDVVNFEPWLALDGGLDGLSCFNKIIKKSSELIKKRGKLILEIAFDQKRDVVKILTNNGFYINKIIKDLANNDRCIISTKI